MAEGELDLLERRVAFVGEFGKGAAEVMGSDGGAEAGAVAVDGIVDGLGTHALAGDAAALVDRSEHQAGHEAGGLQPVVNGDFRPEGHGNGAEAIPFPCKSTTHQRAVALLDLFEAKMRQFFPPQPGAEEQGGQFFGLVLQLEWASTKLWPSSMG